MTKTFLRIFILSLVCAAAAAGKLDITTHDMVIDRLEETVRNLKQPNTAIYIRLADLYADRARLKSMEEVEQKCNDCLKSKSDRNKAIAKYEQALAGAEGEQIQRIILQKTHLFTMNGQPEEAKKVFLAVLKAKNKYKNDLIGESHAGLGELYFREGNFTSAKQEFQKALQYAIQKKAYVQYRLAWCLFNENKAEQSVTLLKSILENKVDATSFRKDVSRDLFTFASKVELTESRVRELLELTSKDERKTNLFFLGQEADRLGNKDGALLVWQIYSEYEDVNKDESLEIQIRTAQTHFDQGDYKKSLNAYTKFNKILDSYSCDEKEACNELRARSRNYVLTWIKREKTKPSPQLSSALQNYVQYNNEDVEMIQWAGHVARFNNKMSDAAKNYRMAAILSAKKINDADSDDEKEFYNKSLNGALQAQIECAEASNDKVAKKQAYEHYLEIHPKGPKKNEMQYQLAYLKYENKQYKDAAEEFYDLALEGQQLNTDTRIKAADLNLDCLALLKDNEQITKNSSLFAKMFNSKRTQYVGIARRSQVQNAVQLFDNGKASNRNAENSLKLLMSASTEGATSEEKIDLLKNRIIMAEKINDLDIVDQSANQMLSIKPLAAKDQEYALSKKLWVAESQLDFKRAFWYAQQLSFHNLNRADKALKLALLAELSGNASHSYYKEFIQYSGSRRQANIIRLKIIRESANPWKSFEEYKRPLLSTPDIYDEALAFVFAKDQNSQKLAANIRPALKQNYGKTLQSFLDLDADQMNNKKIRSHRLKTSSQAQLQKTLKERMALLKAAERDAFRATRNGQFSMQVVTLNRVAREYHRLHKDLLSTPTPRGLSSKQRIEYRKALEAQVAVYKTTAQKIEKEISALWNNSKYFKTLISNAKEEPTALRRIYERELRTLSNYAISPFDREIRNVLSSKPNLPSHQNLQQAQQSVKADPFNLRKLEALRELAQKRGHTSMVAYLDARLNQIEKKRIQ